MTCCGRAQELSSFRWILQNFLVLRRNAQRLARLIRQHQIHIVDAQTGGHAWSAWRATVKAGAHFMLTFDRIEESGPMQRRSLAALMAGERILISSQFLADHLRATFAIDPARIRLIRRGVDLRFFDPDRVRPDQLIALSRRWHIPDGVSLVMTFARPGGWSDIRVLLEALARLRHIKFRCLLIGADDDQAARPEIEREIARLELIPHRAAYRRMRRHAGGIYARRCRGVGLEGS